jgi:hypothetical protein
VPRLDGILYTLQITYGALIAAMQANWLKSQGVKKGDAVGAHPDLGGAIHI